MILKLSSSKSQPVRLAEQTAKVAAIEAGTMKCAIVKDKRWSIGDEVKFEAKELKAEDIPEAAVVEGVEPIRVHYIPTTVKDEEGNDIESFDHRHTQIIKGATHLNPKELDALAVAAGYETINDLLKSIKNGFQGRVIRW